MKVGLPGKDSVTVINAGRDKRERIAYLNLQGNTT